MYKFELEPNAKDPRDPCGKTWLGPAGLWQILGHIMGVEGVGIYPENKVPHQMSADSWLITYSYDLDQLTVISTSWDLHKKARSAIQI